MRLILLILFIIALVEGLVKPRLDKTINGELILWFNERGKRKFIILVKHESRNKNTRD